MAFIATNGLTEGTMGLPQNKPFGSSCPNGQVCLGQEFCTVIGCLCLGVCVPTGISVPIPGLPFDPGLPPPSGPAPTPTPTPTPIPPAPTPAPLPPPQAAPSLGTCVPRAGAVAAVACPAGCHPNKADYFLKSGSFVARGTRCVRNRRRNPLNPRALDRAISRIGSAQNAVARLGFQKKSPRRRKRAPASIC